MKLAGWNIAEAFATKHPQARPRLENWRRHVKEAVWQEPMDIIKTFNSASYIPNKAVWVFNIGADRLITVIDFNFNTVLIKQIMTHNEYMNGAIKNEPLSD